MNNYHVLCGTNPLIRWMDRGFGVCASAVLTLLGWACFLIVSPIVVPMILIGYAAEYLENRDGTTETVG